MTEKSCANQNIVLNATPYEIDKIVESIEKSYNIAKKSLLRMHKSLLTNDILLSAKMHKSEFLNSKMRLCVC